MRHANLDPEGRLAAAGAEGMGLDINLCVHPPVNVVFHESPIDSLDVLPCRRAQGEDPVQLAEGTGRSSNSRGL